MNQLQFLEGMSQAVCTVLIITTDGYQGNAGVPVSTGHVILRRPSQQAVNRHSKSPPITASIFRRLGPIEEWYPLYDIINRSLGRSQWSAWRHYFFVKYQRQ